MAEFKFSCPQCGQHIQCDAGYSGMQINCPACKQTIVVPTAPHSDVPPAVPIIPQATPPRSMRLGTPVLAAARTPVKAKWFTKRKVLIIAASVLILGLVGAGWFAYAKIRIHSLRGKLPPGLVALWSGDGNASDSMGVDAGKVSGNVTYRNGRIGQAFAFDGRKDWVNITSPANLRLQDFTITVWIKRANTSFVSDNNRNGMIFCYGYGLYLNPKGQPTLTKIGADGTHPDTAITDTDWHHLAVAKSGSTMIFYVDGVAYPAPAYNVKFVFSKDASIGGKNSPNWEDTFAGLIDEIGIYNRSLSASEIQGIYAAQK